MPSEVPRPIEASVPKAGPVLAVTAPLAPGQFILVPEDACVSMVDASPEAVDKALRHPRGLPTHEWCLANGPAAPGPGLVGRACRQVSPVQPVAEAGPSGSCVFLPKLGRLLLPAGGLQVWPGKLQAAVTWLSLENAELWQEQDGNIAQIWVQVEELAQARREREKAVHACNQLLRKRTRHSEQRETLEGEVGSLLTRLVQGAGLEGMARVTVPLAVEVDELVCCLHEANKLEGRWRKWLLWEVAGARSEALNWVREHHLLLDGLSSGVSYVVEEALLAGLPPGLLKAFVDGLQDQPSVEEIVQIVWNAMGSKFGPRGTGAQEPAGKAQGPAGEVRGPAGGAQGPASEVQRLVGGAQGPVGKAQGLVGGAA
ncbi:hypothetical protein C0992_008904 [Termitomyces sp. T32_za158]|nr:hypothetical protein C0992_008904 [Termitomyces sp. T32_za158]